MRIFYYLFILLFLNITITISAGELKINVTNIDNNIGSIHYAVYDDASSARYGLYDDQSARLPNLLFRLGIGAIMATE